jgi:hypothetical protein
MTRYIADLPETTPEPAVPTLRMRLAVLAVDTVARFASAVLAAPWPMFNPLEEEGKR